MDLKLHAQCTAVSPAVGFKGQVIQRVIHIFGHIIAVIIEPGVIQRAFIKADGLVTIIFSGQITIVIQIIVIGKYNVAWIFIAILISIEGTEVPLAEGHRFAPIHFIGQIRRGAGGHSRGHRHDHDQRQQKGRKPFSEKPSHKKPPKFSLTSMYTSINLP